MKKTLKTVVTVLVVFFAAIILVGIICSKNAKDQQTGIWENAVYQEDTQLGNGNKRLSVQVKAEDKSVSLTVMTDRDTVGQALIDENLIAGEDSEYGLYVKSVNGMTADYDVNQTYWAFYVGEDYATTGVDSTDIDENTIYRLEYTKG